MEVRLKPVLATEKIMDMLESRGVISRICPGKDILKTELGESRHETIYAADERFGPHKLICVTINDTRPRNFLYHNDAEDFMLIDLPHRTDLIITMALIPKDELEEKIDSKTFAAEDMIAVIFKPNDPYTSFFTMRASCTRGYNVNIFLIKEGQSL